MKGGSIFPAIYDCSKWKFCKLIMNMGAMKLFPFYWHSSFKLVLRAGMSGKATCLIPYFVINKLYNQITLCNQLLFTSSRPEVFCKKAVLQNFEKCTRKHLCWGLFYNKVADRSVFLWISQNFEEQIFHRTPLVAHFWLF